MSAIVFLILRILLALCLYGFLGWAFSTLWRDLKNQNQILASRQAPPIELSSVDGSHVFHSNKPEIVIGRAPACDCALEDLTVSSRHARLAYHHHQWWVEDLGSTNGTFLNQETVAAPLVIASGDQIRCGQVVMIIAISEAQVSEVNRDDSGPRRE